MVRHTALQKTDDSDSRAIEFLETAREAHQKYLLSADKNTLDEAVASYVKVIKLNPSLPESYYRLAGLLFLSGQIDLQDAIKQCQLAIELEPENPDSHIYKGYFLGLAKDFASAEKELRQAIKLEHCTAARPKIVFALMLLDKMRSTSLNFKDFIKAMYYFFAGGLLFAFDSRTLKMLYKTFSDDIKTFRFNLHGKLCEIAQNRDKAFKVYQEGLDTSRNYGVFYERMAKVASDKGDFDVAIECYRSAVKQETYDENTLLKLIFLLQKHYAEGFDELLDLYGKLIVIDDENPRYYYEIGHIYLQKADKMNAISAFKIALDKDDQNPYYHNSLAYCFVQLQQYDDAIVHYKEAIRLNPDSEWTSIVCQALASIYYPVKNNLEAALSSYQMSLMLKPDNVEALISAGDLLFDMQNIRGALDSYLDAVKADTENPYAFARAAMCFWEIDNIEDSMIFYLKALELDPDYDLVLNNLGIIYLDAVGDPDEALKYFEKALKSNHNYTMAYFNKARVLEMQGKKTEAANFYQMALDLNKLTDELLQTEIESRLYGLFS